MIPVLGRAPRACLAVSSAVLLVLTAGGAPPVASAAAQDDDPGAPEARLVLTGLSGVLGADPDGPPPPGDAPPGEADGSELDLELRLLVENQGTTELASLRVFVEVYDRITEGRSVLREALDGERIDRRLLHVADTEVRDGGPVAPGEVAGVELRIPSGDIGWASTGGVYPVQVSVLRGSETLHRLVTAVVVLADPPVGALQTVVVWPLDAAPWRGADGVYPADVDAEIRPGGRLDRLLAALEAVPGAAVHLLPAAHLLEDLQDRADGFREAVRGDDGELEVRRVEADDPAAERAAAFLERVRAAVAAAPVPPVAGPYADHDIASTTSGPRPLSADAAVAAAEGRRRVQRLVERGPDPTTFVATTPLTTEALDIVPGEHLLVPWELVVGPDLASNPDLPFALRTVTAASGRRFTATVADPRVTGLLVAPDLAHGPLAATQRVVAETAMMFFEAPGTTGRPLLLLPPPDWSPPPRMPAAMLTALTAAPWLELTTPSQQLGTRDRLPGLDFRPEAVTGLPSGVVTELIAAHEQLDAIRAALPEGESIDGRTSRELADQLLRAPSLWLRGGDIDRAAALIRDVQGTVDRTFGVVEVPSSANITLPSDTGTIPVTLQRPTGGPLEVCVEVESPGRLTWPDGEQKCVTLAGSGSQTVSFNTRALSRGQFPVRVRVADPTGSRQLAQATLVVRSTSISRPALAVTGTVVVGLLLYGSLRRRRPRSPKLEVVE